MFEKEVPEVFTCDVVNSLVALALVSRILNILEEVPPCIYDLQTIIAIGVWLGIKHRVAGMDKLEVFLVCLAFVLRGLQGLSVALIAPEFLAQWTLADVTDGVGSGMSWRIVNHGSTPGRPGTAQVD